ncbi:MAG: hypothetical protein MUE40_20495 [Anaerolineae bacterium]|jgi:hypothetical protein|nr:hypothetical protein [Anaerolineae bacterium]
MEPLLLLLVGLVMVGAGLLVVAYIWYFIIQRSPLKLLLMFVRTALDRDRVVANPDAPITLPEGERLSHVLTERGAAVKEQTFLPGEDPAAARPRQKATIPAADLGQQGETTSQSGWPVARDNSDEAAPRPFLNIHYETSNDDIQTQQGHL